MILDEIILLIIVICAECEVVSTTLTMLHAFVCPLLSKSVQLVRENERFSSYDYKCLLSYHSEIKSFV